MNTEAIKTLRRTTQAGYADCRKALEASDNDLDKAVKHLRELGYKIQEKHLNKDTPHGVIDAYIHPGNRIGALVEVRCETDFVAKTDALRHFVREVAMQVVAMNPKYISRENVPQEELDKVVSTQMDDEYAEARLENWCAENCLLDQAYMRDGSVSIRDVLSSLIVSLGESCKISKIQRWEI